MPYRENSLYVTLEEAVDEIARVYYPTNHYEAADDFTQACKDGKLKTLFEASHQEVGGWEWRQGHQSVHSCNLIVRRADLLVIYPDLWKELSSKTANPAKGEYVYNKTTKRIEFWSPVDAESVLSQHGKGLLGKLGAAEPSKAPPKVSKAAELSEPTIAATGGSRFGRRPASQSCQSKVWEEFDQKKKGFSFDHGELSEVARQIGTAMGYLPNSVEKMIRKKYLELKQKQPRT